MRVIVRYVRLFFYFVAFSFSRSFEFRLDFFFRIFMDAIYYAVAIGFFRILFLHTPSLGGWDEAQMMIFVAAYCMVDALNMTLFSNNIWQLPTFVNRGDLDYYLIRPVSSLFFLSLRDFAANSFVNLIMTVGMLVWAVQRYPEPISWTKMVIFLLLIVNGTFLFFCLNMLATLPVFFTHSAQGFGQLIWSLMKFGEKPDRIFSGWTHRALTSFIPFCLIASFPTRVLLEKLDARVLLQTLGVTLVFFVFVVWAWGRALRNYSSASS